MILLHKSYMKNSINFFALAAASLCLLAVSCGKQQTTPTDPDTPDTPVTPDEPETGTTIKDVLEAEIGSTFEVKNVTVVGANTHGVLLNQDDSYIYAFHGEEHGLQVGDVVTVSGTTATRNGLTQFGSGCTLTKTGTAEVVFPESQTLELADIESYMNAPEVKYVTYTGTIMLSGNYTNVELEKTDIKGSLDYMTEEFKSEYAGHSVTITGWAFGSYKTYLYTIPVEIEDHGVEETVIPEGAIYYNNFDRELATQTYGDKGSSWPFIADGEFDGWMNEMGSGASDVNYDCSSISVRTNQSSKGSLSEYDGSGKNNIFFSTTPSYFTIEDIAVSERNLKLTFGAQRYSQGGTNTFLKSDFTVRLSEDGEVWSPAIDYDFDKEDVAGNWRLATANFTLPEGTEKLCIKFEAKISSVNRLDDVLLTPGEGGQAIEFGKEEETPVSTIAEVLDSPVDNSYKIQGTVIAIHYKGFLVKDDTGIILTFKKKHDAQVGDVITLEGTTTTYGGFKQFGESSTFTKTGTTTVTYPEPEDFDGAKFTEWAANPTIKYIRYTGNLTSTRDQYYQYHYNVAVEGTDIVGSISYPTNDQLDIVKSLLEKDVTVTGYAIGLSGTDTQYLNTMATEIEEAAE